MYVLWLVWGVAGEIVAWVDWSVVEQWADLAPDARDDDYKAFKARVEAAMFSLFEAYFPELAKLVGAGFLPSGLFQVFS